MVVLLSDVKDHMRYVHTYIKIIRLRVRMEKK